MENFVALEAFSKFNLCQMVGKNQQWHGKLLSFVCVWVRKTIRRIPTQFSNNSFGTSLLVDGISLIAAQKNLGDKYKFEKKSLRYKMRWPNFNYIRLAIIFQLVDLIMAMKKSMTPYSSHISNLITISIPFDTLTLH